MIVQGYEVEAKRRNEKGEMEYLYDGEWYTYDELREMKSEEDYWKDWANDLDHQDD